MSVNKHRKCARCSKTRAEDMRVTYHRFPNPGLHNWAKARAWATYCWPDEDWTAAEALESLHKTHKVLCGRHFHSTQFYDNQRQKLSIYAVPGSNEVMELLTEKVNVLNMEEPKRRFENEVLSEQVHRKPLNHGLVPHTPKSGTSPVQTAQKSLVSGIAQVAKSQVTVEDPQIYQQEYLIDQRESQVDYQESRLYSPGHQGDEEFNTNESELQESLQKTQVDQEKSPLFTSDYQEKQQEFNEVCLEGLEESQEDLEESQVDLQEFQVEVEEREVQYIESSDDDELSPQLDGFEVEPLDWGQIKLDLLDVGANEDIPRLPKIAKAPSESKAITQECKKVRKRVQCSRCSTRIRYAALYRCVECVDAAICCDCARVAHATHCVLRMPSTRVYRVLEDLFRQLRLEVRARLYPDKDMLHLGRDETASGAKAFGKSSQTKERVDDNDDCPNEASVKTGGKCSQKTAPLTQDCAYWQDESWGKASGKCSQKTAPDDVPDDEWLDIDPLRSDSESPLLLHHVPLIELKKEPPDDVSGDELSQSLDGAESALSSPRIRKGKIPLILRDASRGARKKRPRKDFHRVRSNEAINSEDPSRTPVIPIKRTKTKNL